MNEISGDGKESAISKELPEKEQLRIQVEKESALGERQEMKTENTLEEKAKPIELEKAQEEEMMSNTK